MFREGVGGIKGVSDRYKKGFKANIKHNLEQK